MSSRLYIRIDNKGEIIQEKIFDIGQTEIFSDVDWIKPNDSDLVVVGVSAKISVKNPAESFAKNFIMLYDPNGEMIHEGCFNFVEGVHRSLLPKVCCLDNGNAIALYRKESTDPNKTLLSARCYIKKLKLLWEKDIFVANKSPFSFDVVSCNSAGFAVGAILQTDGFEFYSFDEDGTKTGYTLYKGMVGIPGFNLKHINGRTIAVFEEGTAGSIKECTIKAKVIALD